MKPKIILAQINSTVGDFAENLLKIQNNVAKAIQKKADLIVFPELAVCGYPPEDLLYRQFFHQEVQKALEEIRALSQSIDILIGYPETVGDQIFNAAVWFREKKIIGNYRKHKLPNYSVFDEARYFKAGNEALVVDLGEVAFGVLICEDFWFPEPIALAKNHGAQAILCLNASPYSIHKQDMRHSIARQRIQETQLPIYYLNAVGGQDELVFDGASFVMNQEGKICAKASCFEETLLEVTYPLPSLSSCQRNEGMVVRDLNSQKKKTESWILNPESLSINGTTSRKPDLIEKETKNSEQLPNIYKALVLGTRDYVRKNGFTDVILGLSGGIDSALTLAIAVDALGKDHVHALLMPSQYTRSMSLEDAEIEAKNLGIDYQIIPIQDTYEHYLKMLKPYFDNQPLDTTEENIQARIRGMILMAFSNKFGHMVLTTGNKSETAVGYVTLYGDMVGGFAPLKDVFKVRVYELAHHRNRLSNIIPQRIFDRPPSAELAPDQQDQDSLPPYGILDKILELFIEKDLDPIEIIERGFDEKTVNRIVKLVLNNEYKRRQGPPGIRITEKAFGRDRRYPITSKYLIF